MNNNLAERENSRGLKPSEKKAKKMFGNTINLDEVKIVDSGVMHAIVTFNSDLVVVRRYPHWDDYYNHLIGDFQQWNRELPQTSCSAYMTYN